MTSTIDEPVMPTTAATVSVIMTTYNRAEYLPVALDSLLAQTRPVDEIIVVNDASTDRTREVLEGYGTRIRAVNRDENRGKPAGLNLAIPQASGAYIWLFDDDDAALPDAVENHMAFLSSRSDIDFSYSDKQVFIGDGDIWQSSGWTLSRLPLIEPEALLVRSMLSMNTLFQGMLIPKRCFTAVGAFDETLHRCEDHEMLLRLARHFRGANIQTPTFVYRQHAGARGAGDNTHGGGERFRVMMEYKKRIFSDMRAQYPLCCYIPGIDAGDDTELTAVQRAQAFVQRASVMFRHGLVDQGIEDLQQSLQSYPCNRVEHDWMSDILSQAFDVETWIWPRWSEDLSRISATVTQHGVDRLPIYCLRGLYWNTRREWQKNARKSAAVSASLTGYFALAVCYHKIRSLAQNSRSSDH